MQKRAPGRHTCAMLLIGFAGIGFMGIRRLRNQYTFTPNAVMNALMRSFTALA
jgi:hypothetical protein